jgi:hypothetical protein
MSATKTVFVKGFGNVQVVRQDSQGDIFFDVYNEEGRCLNEKKPFWVEPSEDDVRQCLAAQTSMSCSSGGQGAPR